MPLDNNLFADFSRSILANVCATRHLPADHIDKFSIGTPKLAWSAMVRTWEHSPTPERIAEDIMRWKKSLQEVVRVEGISLDHGVLRHGRRLEEQSKIKRKQKALQIVKSGAIHKMPIHDSAKRVYNRFLAIDLTRDDD